MGVGLIHRGLARAVGLIAFACLVSASPAAASASFVYPGNGQTVALDKKMNFDFRWTMPAGEASPAVDVGTQPNYDPDNSFLPFDTWCGGDVQVAYSCAMGGDEGQIPVAGVHYAVIVTEDADYNEIASPEVRFTIPYRIGLGCVPTAKCEWPRLHNTWYRFGDAAYGHPYSNFNLWGWTNGPTLTMSYKLKRGSRLLKQGRRTVTANVQFDVPGPDHFELTVFALPGIPSGTPLRLTVGLTSGNVSLTRTYSVRAGGGPRRGAISRFES